MMSRAVLWSCLATATAGCQLVFPLEADDAAPDAAIELVCPGDYKPIGGRFYRLDPELRGWDNARGGCEADRVPNQDSSFTHLLVLSSADEIGLVRQAFRTELMATPHWIGLTDRASEQEFRWVSAEPAPVPADEQDPWHSGEPNDLTGDEDCVTFGRVGESVATMNDLFCSAGQPAICECDAFEPRP